MSKKKLMIIAIAGLCGIAILYGSVKGEILKSGNVRFTDSNQKNPSVQKEVVSKLELPKQGKIVTDKYSKKLVIDIPYGTKEEELGFREGELDGQEWTVAPSAIDIGKNGEIYVGDPANGQVGTVLNRADDTPDANAAIKVFSNNGKYLRIIPIPSNVDWRGDFGLDAQDNLYVLTQKQVFKQAAGESKFEPIGPVLKDAWLLEVLPSGNFNALDYAPLPSDNLRSQKFDKKGKLVKTIEQSEYDDNLLEFEDYKGNKVNLWFLSGGITGAKYKVVRSKTSKREEVTYEPNLPKGYYYRDGKVIGHDNNDRMYELRIIAPDIPTEKEQDRIEKERRTEVWVDIIDTQGGLLSSVRLEPDKELYGDFVTHHTYKVDRQGNIYQLQVDKEKARVWKYSWK